MAASLQLVIFSSLLVLCLVPLTPLAQQSFRPKALLLPVSKDASTLQYTAIVNQRTPLVPLKVVIDLGGQHLWVDCERNFASSTFRPIRCGSAQCSLAASTACSGSNTCVVFPQNGVTGTTTVGDIGQDVVAIESTDGSNPGRVATAPGFIITCAPTFLLESLASGAMGMAGLGRTRVSLPAQFSATFSFHRKFALCLSSGNGVVFFGNGPYIFLPGTEDLSKSLTFTPLFSAGDRSSEYFIGVKSIKVNEKVVPLNTTLLSIGGTKISTVKPFTVLQSSIFEAVTTAFVREAAAMNIKRVAPAAPFDVCFSSENIVGTRLGAAVPTISLVLQNEKVVWNMVGSNSMVEVSRDVMCLGFVNGGLETETSIVIGGHQLENNLLQFDLATSRLGFSSTLLGRQTTCANFNFTSNA
ncbi:basic 7S globulin-like [Carica papaya]|uniref:basic 7S globulin-like n=1 Tax=Carica papaya TaxID=3649 RepID=UPI000B8C999C|nr:basic 7S globulin-like [Carica papaya]